MWRRGALTAQFPPTASRRLAIARREEYGRVLMTEAPADVAGCCGSTGAVRAFRRVREQSPSGMRRQRAPRRTEPIRRKLHAIRSGLAAEVSGDSVISQRWRARSSQGNTLTGTPTATLPCIIKDSAQWPGAAVPDVRRSGRPRQRSGGVGSAAAPLRPHRGAGSCRHRDRAVRRLAHRSAPRLVHGRRAAR
jgi:hypothetical protein